jgi:hypothetical protein
MTSRFILNKFDLDLSSSSLLVRFGLFLFVVVVTSTINGILVIDERVFSDRRLARLRMMWVCRG